MASILLIEDDVLAARLVMKVLGSQGYTIRHVGTGSEGLQTARELRPNLILVDLGLPDLDGKVVAMQLRHILSATVIVAFTAEAGAKARRLALAYGCHDFISKPIDTRAFPNLIAHLIENAGEADPPLTIQPSAPGI